MSAFNSESLEALSEISRQNVLDFEREHHRLQCGFYDGQVKDVTIFPVKGEMCIRQGCLQHPNDCGHDQNTW